jgi:hypothetical protein
MAILARRADRIGQQAARLDGARALVFEGDIASEPEARSAVGRTAA